MKSHSKKIRSLIKAIGYDNFVKLSKALGGSSVYIPSLYEMEKPQMAHSMQKDRREGQTLAQLAEKYKVSQATVRRCLAKQGQYDYVANASEKPRKNGKKRGEQWQGYEQLSIYD